MCQDIQELVIILMSSYCKAQGLPALIQRIKGEGARIGRGSTMATPQKGRVVDVFHQTPLPSPAFSALDAR